MPTPMGAGDPTGMRTAPSLGGGSWGLRTLPGKWDLDGLRCNAQDIKTMAAWGSWRSGAGGSAAGLGSWDATSQGTGPTGPPPRGPSRSSCRRWGWVCGLAAGSLPRETVSHCAAGCVREPEVPGGMGMVPGCAGPGGQPQGGEQAVETPGASVT